VSPTPPPTFEERLRTEVQRFQQIEAERRTKLARSLELIQRNPEFPELVQLLSDLGIVTIRV
jgi:hypothetical protein